MKPETPYYFKNGKKVSIDRLNDFYARNNVVYAQITVPQYYSETDLEAIKELDPKFNTRTRLEKSVKDENDFVFDFEDNKLRVSLVQVLNRNCTLEGKDLVMDQAKSNKIRDLYISKHLELFISAMLSCIQTVKSEPTELALTKMIENECKDSMIQNEEFAALCLDIRSMLKENNIPVSKEKFLYLVGPEQYYRYKDNPSGHFYTATKKKDAGALSHLYEFDFCQNPEETMFSPTKHLVFLEGEEIREKALLNKIAEKAIMPVSQGFERDPLEKDLTDTLDYESDFDFGDF